MKKKNSGVYVGLVVGDWVVLRFSEIRTVKGKNYPYWTCRCVCGAESDVLGWNLGKSSSTGCGCRSAAVKHGRYRSRLYNIWTNMLARCKYPTATHYRMYGGRGIKVCDRWHDFSLFFADVGDPPSSRHTLDRFPNRDGNYEPSNVRWATARMQNRNKDCVKLDEQKVRQIRLLKGEKTQKQIAAMFGVSRGMIGHILRNEAWI